jgi:small subunit ribosomal protein S16
LFIIRGSFLAGPGIAAVCREHLSDRIRQAERTMVTIRLNRRGGKKEPFYHVVVTDSRRRGTGLEQLGFYNPVARGNSIELRLDLARVDYWLSVGAQPSDRVAQLIKNYRKSQPTAVAA